MTRLMRDPAFRAEQVRCCFAEHVAPLNRLVDELKQNGEWLPYIAPMYGGINARLLCVLRDPGPMTRDDGGSGFLCWENNDATAEMVCELFAGAGIDASDVVPWNAFPWYINRHPKAKELERGVEPWMRLIDLLPNLRVVMLLGGSAHDGWERLARRYSATVTSRRLSVIKTYHTSRQAFWHKDPAVRESRRANLREAFQDAAKILTAPAL